MVQTSETLEQKVSQTSQVFKNRRPRKGPLLERLNFRSKTFYEELVVPPPNFAQAAKNYMLSHHLTKSRSSETGLGVASTALYNYAGGKDVLVPLEAYNTIAASPEGIAAGLCAKQQPEIVSGQYVGIILAIYFDKVDGRTKDRQGQDHSMEIATGILLSKMGRVSPAIAERYHGSNKERKVVSDGARDLLTGRKGLMQYAVFKKFEDAVIAHSGLAGAVGPEQIREAFKGADSKNLTTDLELRIKGLRPSKPYYFDGQATPPGVDYLEGDRIATQSLGQQKFNQGTVLESPFKDTQQAAEWRAQDLGSSYYIKVQFDNGRVKLLIVKPGV